MGEVFKVRSFAGNGVQGRPGVGSEARAHGLFSVSRSFPRLNLLQLERPPVLTSHTCSPLTHFGGLSRSHKTDAGDGEPTEERICFFTPLQKQYVVSLPLITQWGGTKHGIQLVLHFPVQMLCRPPEPPNPAWVLPSE